nr:unnamed protein product [Callosobruchus chinensis]
MVATNLQFINVCLFVNNQDECAVFRVLEIFFSIGLSPFSQTGSLKLESTVARQRSTFLTIGAAQGSVLSPLLFISYITDLKLSGFMINYADDTSVVVSATTPNELLRIIQVVKDEMNEWCQANRLILNKNKTRNNIIWACFTFILPACLIYMCTLPYPVLWAALIGPFAKPTISFCISVGILGMTFGLGGSSYLNVSKYTDTETANQRNLSRQFTSDTDLLVNPLFSIPLFTFLEDKNRLPLLKL